MFLVNGIVMENIERMELKQGDIFPENRLSNCDSVMDDKETQEGTVPRWTQQMLIVLGIIIIIIAGIATWMKLKIARAENTEDPHRHFCCRALRWVTLPSNQLPLWQSLLIKAIITIATTLIGGICSMVVINFLSPQQESLKETMIEIFQLTMRRTPSAWKTTTTGQRETRPPPTPPNSTT